jgi:hypothetical protein
MVFLGLAALSVYEANSPISFQKDWHGGSHSIKANFIIEDRKAGQHKYRPRHQWSIPDP